MFDNIKVIRDELVANNRILTLFNFEFNNVRCCVVIQLYSQDEYKPKYALLKMVFWDLDDNTKRLNTHINSKDFVDLDTAKFFQFFRIPYGDGLGNVVKDFKVRLSEKIPRHIDIPDDLRGVAIAYIDNNRNRNNGIYLVGLVRLGLDRNGNQTYRSAETNEKAQILRPDVYQFVADDRTVTFRFSENPNDERNREQIIQAFRGN